LLGRFESGVRSKKYTVKMKYKCAAKKKQHEHNSKKYAFYHLVVISHCPLKTGVAGP
jgi:hypothetical protein